jgi:hypothetical protein
MRKTPEFRGPATLYLADTSPSHVWKRGCDKKRLRRALPVAGVLVGQWLRVSLATGAAIGPEGMRRARHEFIHCAFI